MAEFENLREQRRQQRREMRESQCMNRFRPADHKGHIWTGVFIILIGIALLLPLPDWVISWQMFLVALGIFLGLRHNFRGPAWIFLVLIGGAFLINEIYPEVPIRNYIWPIVLIAVGMFILFRPRRYRHHGKDDTETEGTTGNTGTEQKHTMEKNYSEDYIDSTSIFGGVKKNVLTKNFKGGDIVNIFGGAEINLGQSDIHGRVELEVTQIFGGTKLLVPSNWEVKPEMTAILGGIEDKRDVTAVTNPDKVLVLRGTSIFGGIEIKSF